MLSFLLDDCLNALNMKTEEQLDEWVIGSQVDNWGLERIIDDYVLFYC
ncbi:hypothetical protein [Providencia huaxiensis]